MRAKLLVAASVILWSAIGSTVGAQHHGHHGGHSGHHGHGLHLHLGHGLSHHHHGHGLLHLGHSLSHLFSTPSYYRSYSTYYPRPYEVYPRPSTSYYYYDPLANFNYGPQAIERFMGVDRGLPAPAIRELKPPAEIVPKVRTSNIAARQRAARFRKLGDEFFGEQRFLEALERYKLAIKSAPDLAEFYFRQGHAYIAMYHYDQALAAFKRGLAVDDSWAKSDFRLEKIYGDSHVAKTAHVESLAGAALADTRNGDLMFLLGLHLYYDNQPLRAQKFFRRAAELSGADARHLRPFLVDEKAKKDDGKVAAGAET